jgi:hypothetical protein
VTIRNPTPACALIALCTACTPIPAARAYQPAVGAAFDFEPGRGPLVDAHAEDAIWLVTPGDWGAATGPVQVPPPVVTPPGCRPAPAAVPGPVPLAVAAGAFTFSRKLRKRISL